MGLSSKIKTIVSPDGREDVANDRFRVARGEPPTCYVVVDTHARATPPCDDGTIIWWSEHASATDAVDELRALKAAAAERAATLNAEG